MANFRPLGGEVGCPDCLIYYPASGEVWISVSQAAAADLAQIRIVADDAPEAHHLSLRWTAKQHQLHLYSGRIAASVKISSAETWRQNRWVTLAVHEKNGDGNNRFRAA